MRHGVGGGGSQGEGPVLSVPAQIPGGQVGGEAGLEVVSGPGS